MHFKSAMAAGTHRKVCPDSKIPLAARLERTVAVRKGFRLAEPVAARTTVAVRGIHRETAWPVVYFKSYESTISGLRGHTR